MSSQKVTKKIEKISEKKPLKVLSSDEINRVIDVWSENVDALRKTCKNSHIYLKMCEQLRSYGIRLTPTELRNRIHNLSRRYRAEKNKMGVSGGTRSTWTYFEALNCFLKSFKQNNMTELMDESFVADSKAASKHPEAIEEPECMEFAESMRDDPEGMKDPENPAESMDLQEKEDFEGELLDDDSEYCVLYTQVSEPESPRSPLSTISQDFLNNDEPATSSAGPSKSPSTFGEPSATPSTSKTRAKFAPPKRGKKNIQERLLDLAEKENEKFETFMSESLAYDQQIIEQMRQNNELLKKVIEKM
ncbi:uncharacterized protein LOC110675840 [Aedes aegypti]|uniref:Myb/SANT-like DNA-binding domain-containing protein n=1 Tax=Aedes aegypti TaxID=7159 RepID=A0A6I8U081_AEDAE|nr:uncharacterized protein LOC5576730 [Aedes aegypti]XP_021694716.1 uncharacterized protein LOC110674757 [Aedes aegypti]XP_021697402.1 uncharacterized protein LOC110675840 [Aedes aegypti]